MRVMATASAVLLFSLSLFLGHPSSVGGAQDQEEREGVYYEQQGVAHNNVFASAQLQQVEYGDATAVLQDPPVLQSNTIVGYNALGIDEQQNSNDLIGHVVSNGDTLSSIAEQYGVGIQTLVWANDINLSDTLSVGSVITVLPVNGVLHTIDYNETLSDIAAYYDVDIQDILRANDIGNAELIFSGQRIIIPGATREQGQVVKQNYAATASKHSYFLRPADGVLSQGLHLHNAIDIANSCGSPIYASLSGVVDIVVNSGYNGGYGRYIMLHHSDGIQTLYAHLSKSLVVPGQTVRQGEMIGYMGTTGRSTGCHVHFEVRGAANPVR